VDLARAAVFSGLVVDEADNAVDVVYLGGHAYYVIDDAGFERHIPSDVVDRQVLEVLKEQVYSQRDLVVESMLDFLQQDDLFTKAAIESSVDQMDENIEQLLQTGLPEEARSWLGLMGFRVIIDVHGAVVGLDFPEAPLDED
jgi:predicted ATPase